MQVTHTVGKPEEQNEQLVGHWIQLVIFDICCNKVWPIVQYLHVVEFEQIKQFFWTISYTGSIITFK